MKKINVGVLGIGGFSDPWIRIYQLHPNVDKVYLCARTESKLKAKAEQCGIPESQCYTSYEAMLADPDIDAVHVLSPTFDHYEHTMMALNAGKHVAVAVAMGETIDQLQDICAARKKAGKNYMLMETSAYSRDIIYVKKLIASGQFGRVQFISGSHMQATHLINKNGRGLEERWDGYPPMLYGSHATSPLYVLTGKLADYVVCFGSGDIGDDLAKCYGCKDSYQSTLVSLKDSDICGEIHRTMFWTNRQDREHFDVYGSEMSYEWEQKWGEGPLLHYGMCECKRIIPDDQTDELPDELIWKGEKSDALNWRRPFDSLDEFSLRLGHAGSYPHLVHEFVSSIIEERKAYLDADVAANITAIGIMAVESAKCGGERKYIPDFSID